MQKVVKTSFEFILLDADYEIQIHDGIEKPLLRLWGRSGSKRVEVRVSGYLPYLYAEAGEEEIKAILAKGSDQLKNWLVNTTGCTKSTYFGGSPRKVTKLLEISRIVSPRSKISFNKLESKFMKLTFHLLVDS